MHDRLHIGINTLFLLPGEVGGTEVYLRGMLPPLLANPDLRLTLFTNRENHDSFDGLERVLVPVEARHRPRRILAEQIRLPRLVKQAECAVLWNPGYTAPFFAPCPQVTTIHDCQWRTVPEGFSWGERRAHDLLVGLAAKRADRIATVSEFSRAEIVRELGLTAERVSVTLEGWDPAFAEPSPSPFEAPYFLCVSNTYPHKNAGRLVEAFAAVADALPHALVLVGQPGKGEPPPHPRVIRRHRLAFAELAGAMQHADALFMPSLYEGFGLPVLEGMAAGVPVFASRSGSIPEVGGEAIRYFDGTDTTSIAEAFRTAANDASRTEFIARGKERAAEFSWKASAERLLKSLREAAG